MILGDDPLAWVTVALAFSFLNLIFCDRIEGVVQMCITPENLAAFGVGIIIGLAILGLCSLWRSKD